MRLQAPAAPAIAAPVAVDRRTTWAAYGIAMLAALALGHFLIDIPIQVSESFGALQQLSSTWSELLKAKSTQDGFLRPLIWASFKIVYDVSGGNYTPWFRWTHALQVLILAVMVVALLRPRTWRDVACLPFAFAVLFGMHTFTGTVQEAFPVNIYLTVLILSLGAALVALARYHWVNDLVAVVLFVAAVLSLETGLLLWVIFIGATLLGARGVSRPALAVLTVLLGAYFYARFGLLDNGAPDLGERSSGFGFSVLEPPELVSRFGENPLPFYLYNIAGSFLSVLFSEPTSGVFRATQAVIARNVRPVLVVNAVASLGLATLLMRFMWHRRRDWLSRRFEHDDRVVALFWLILAGNAAISYPYSKDSNLATAGAFLAPAAFVAIRHLWATTRQGMAGRRIVLVAVALLAVSSAWSLRTLGLFTVLRRAAVVERLDWAYIESDIADGSVIARTDAARALLQQLRNEALIARPAPPAIALPLIALYGE
jgi:hypothetical protein